MSVSHSVCNLKNYTSAELSKLSQRQDMLPRQFKIKKLTWETGGGDIYTWELEPSDGKPFSFKPGQFNMLYAHGQGEVPISICADSENGPLIHTTRAVGGVTKGMAQLKEGDVIGVRGPFGSAWPVDNAKGKDVVIICGGMGLPPLRPVIYHILNHRDAFQNVYLLYGARTPLDIVYRSELEQWHHENKINVLMTVDKAEGQWQGNIGVVPQLLNQITLDTKNVCTMMCGPEVMMHFSHLALQKIGVAEEDIYVSMERNMKCAIGHCGHCQWGPHFICKDGPVFRFDQIRDLFAVHQL